MDILKLDHQHTKMKRSTKSVNATVIKVVGSDIRISDPFTGKRSEYGNYVVVKEDKSGDEHTFMNGSMNQVSDEYRNVGQKGHLVWHSSASYNLPFFSGICSRS